LICDDDVEVDSKSLEFAFRVWEKNPNRLVGLFTQSHDIDLNRREWVYTVHKVHASESPLPVPVYVRGWGWHGARAGDRGRGAEL